MTEPTSLAALVAAEDTKEIDRLERLLKQARARRTTRTRNVEKAQSTMTNARQAIAKACADYQREWNLLVKDMRLGADTLRSLGIVRLDIVCAEERRKAQAALNPDTSDTTDQRTAGQGPTPDGDAQGQDGPDTPDDTQDTTEHDAADDTRTDQPTDTPTPENNAADTSGWSIPGPWAHRTE